MVKTIRAIIARDDIRISRLNIAAIIAQIHGFRNQMQDITAKIAQVRGATAPVDSIAETEIVTIIQITESGEMIIHQHLIMRNPGMDGIFKGIAIQIETDTIRSLIRDVHLETDVRLKQQVEIHHIDLQEVTPLAIEAVGQMAHEVRTLTMREILR